MEQFGTRMRSEMTNMFQEMSKSKQADMNANQQTNDDENGKNNPLPVKNAANAGKEADFAGRFWKGQKKELSETAARRAFLRGWNLIGRIEAPADGQQWAGQMAKKLRLEQIDQELEHTGTLGEGMAKGMKLYQILTRLKAGDTVAP